MQQLWMFEPYELKRDVWDRNEIDRMLYCLKKSKDYLNNIHGLWIKSRDILIFMMMFEEGCRPGEITSIKFKDIDFNKKVIFISGNNNKVRKDRIIPLSESLIQYFNNYIQFPRWLWKKSEYLFPSFANKSRPLSAGRWKHIFREKICKPAGLWKKPDTPSKSRTSSYCLRHSRATEMLDQTGDLDLVAHFLGHKDTRITRSYTHFTKSRWDKLVNATNRIYIKSESEH